MANKPGIGVQLYSIRDFMEKDFMGSLEKVAEIGYDCVEFAGFGGYKADELRAKLDSLGLKCVCTHTGVNEMQADNIDATVDYIAALGAKYCALPSLPEEYRATSPMFAEKIEIVKNACAKFAAKGIQLLYHNHDFEYTMVGDKFALDILYETVPGLMPEFDTCWVKFAGQCPVDYLKKYAGRTPVVHLKDFICKEMRNRDGFEFRPVGEGCQDIPSIISAALEGGAKAFVVEQDLSYGMTSMESITRSREYLKSIGY